MEDLKPLPEFSVFEDASRGIPYFENNPTAAMELYNQVQEVVRHSQLMPHSAIHSSVNVGRMLAKWCTSKRRFLHLDQFAHSLIYKIDVDETTQVKIDNLYDTMSSSAYDCVNKFMLSEDVRSDLQTLLLKNKLTLIDNRVFEVSELKTKYEKLVSGMKVTRAIGVILAYHYDACRFLQDQFSEYIQSIKMSGRFSASIHPLDYLTSSTTSYNWRSCHALDGEYRCGSLSYMVDSSTVVCYLASEEKQSIPMMPFEWYSKRWRRLLHVSINGGSAIAGRPYPMNVLNDRTLSVGEDLCLSLCSGNKPRYNMYRWRSFRTSVVKDEHTGRNVSLDRPFYYFGDMVGRHNEHFLKGEDALHYDDIKDSPHYSPLYCEFFIPSQSRGLSAKDRQHYAIGESCPCPFCGVGTLDEENCMGCENCRDTVQTIYSRCETCGDPMTHDEVYYYGDKNFCNHCFSLEYCYCAECGDTITKEEGPVCEHCIEEDEEEF